MIVVVNCLFGVVSRLLCVDCCLWIVVLLQCCLLCVVCCIFCVCFVMCFLLFVGVCLLRVVCSYDLCWLKFVVCLLLVCCFVVCCFVL